jgi:hypothetical protein
MRERNGKFAIIVDSEDRWLEFYDLTQISIEDVLKEAKYYAEDRDYVVVYECVKEYEIKGKNL